VSGLYVDEPRLSVLQLIGVGLVALIFALMLIFALGCVVLGACVLL